MVKKNQRSYIPGFFLVKNRKALVPLGYDVRYPQCCELKVDFTKTPTKGKVVFLSELVDIVTETTSEASVFPNCYCTSTGRWIHKSCAMENPEPDQLFEFVLKEGAKPKLKIKPKK